VLLLRVIIITIIQRYNAILLHDSFVKEEEELGSFQLDFCTFLLNSVIFYFTGNTNND